MSFGLGFIQLPLVAKIVRRPLWLSSRCKPIFVLLPIIFLFLVDSGYRAQELDYFPGFARFKADYDIVFFPPQLCRLYFDTSDCPACKDSLPPWRFIGNLKIDSVIRNNITEPLVRESQIAGLEIHSPGLLTILDLNRCYLLGRRIRAANPYDTLRYDVSTLKSVPVPDVAKHFFFAFDSLRSTKEIIRQLFKVPGLENVGVIPIPILDYTDEPLEPQIGADSLSLRPRLNRGDDSSSTDE